MNTLYKLLKTMPLNIRQKILSEEIIDLEKKISFHSTMRLYFQCQKREAVNMLQENKDYGDEKYD